MASFRRICNDVAGGKTFEQTAGRRNIFIFQILVKLCMIVPPFAVRAGARSREKGKSITINPA